jgi:predicted nucleotidyltransferase component of viral defense system
LKLPFYLTGGTALSRYYFKHRYSDDIDLFINSDSSYTLYVKRLAEVLANQPPEFCSFMNERFIKSENYTQIYVRRESVILKIDLVNDVAFHFGEIAEDKILGKVDSWRNILSNKVTASYRMEIKDFVDIWIISKHYSFNWMEIFNDAKHKDPGVDPVSLSDLFRSFPFENLDLIKWIITPSAEVIKNEFNLIADDILYGENNSLKNAQP